MTFTSERHFEDTLIDFLVNYRGWSGGVLENPTEQDLLDNWAKILYSMNEETDRLNHVPLNKEEMTQLVQQINTLQNPLLKNDFINGQSVSIKRENPDDNLHYGKEVSLKLFDKKEIAGGDSNYQIARQPRFTSQDKVKGDKRGDFMLLINGLPVIHVELKRSGVPVSTAVNQIQRYIHNGAFSRGLFSLVQVFAVMNQEDMRYFANPGTDTQTLINWNYVFKWADFDNEPVGNWKAIASTFLSIPMAHQLIGYYTVPDKADEVLKVLRSYQIYAIREIVDRIQQMSWHEQRQLGGYVWHTTGSGKTLTSFKAAELLASYGYSDKVVFLMDRIELGTQTLNEFRSFADFEDDVQGTDNTEELVAKLKSDRASEQLIVTSIQKMALINEDEHGAGVLNKVRDKRLTIIIDEAHRSTFGDMLLTIKETFPDAVFFGFTGTPIHEENKKKDSTTATVFGEELHRYSLSDGIRDENVLGFDVTQVSTIDYDELRQDVALKEADAKTVEEVFEDDDKAQVYRSYMDPKQFPMLGYKDEHTGKYVKGLETDYVVTDHFKRPNHREKVVEDMYSNWMNLSQGNRYSALLTTSSREEAIEYYRLLKANPLGIKVTALFDSNLNESDTSIMVEDGLAEIITDYNEAFNTSYTIPTHRLFKKDLSARLARKGRYKHIDADDVIHVVVVVDQLLTGYDSKWINTLYVDKKMEYANIIQAFSRTNRLNGDEKPFGSIRYYRFIYSMEANINRAVEAYSGGRPAGLFVDKLGGNLRVLNRLTEDIHSLFSNYHIENFESLPNDQEGVRLFARYFNEFSEHLEAAFIQGFRWEQSAYTTRTSPNEPETDITVLFTQDMYDTWLTRYQEIEKGEGGGPNSSGYELKYTLMQKNSDRIDYDYLNRHFTKFIRSKHEGDAAEQERIKADLHRFFAKLTAEQQRFAHMVINDIEKGELVVEGDKTFTDYINDYQERSEANHIAQVVDAFGVDEEQLQYLISTNITKANLDEFGRFEKLKSTIDSPSARTYLESRLQRKLKGFEVTRLASNTLQEFILQEGFDLDEYVDEM